RYVPRGLSYCISSASPPLDTYTLSLHDALPILLQRIDTTRLRQRWHALAPRERLALAALAAFLLGLALYGGLWLPVERQRAQALADFQQQRELLAYLQARAPEARALGDRAEPSVDRKSTRLN